MLQRREIIAAEAGALAVAVYTVLVLSTGQVPLADFATLLGFYLQSSFSLWLVMGFVALLVQLYRHRPVNGTGPGPISVVLRSITDRWERDRFVSLFWPPLLFAVLMASFNAFKQMVLPLAGFRYDPLFAWLDRLLFLGNDPWRVLHAAVGSPAAVLVTDRAYHGWFVPMAFGVLACAWLPTSTYRLRNQYMLSYIAIWVGTGSILAFLLPSAGPCFYEHFVGPSAHFAGLTRDLLAAQAATGSELASLSNQAGLLRLFGGHTLTVGAGISAMPSVHNGLAVLFAIAAYRINKWAGYAFAAYAFLIYLGSVYLGWHYALDGLVSAGLTFAIWRAVGRLMDRFEAPEASQEPTPVPA
jgi:hypothetical protein